MNWEVWLADEDYPGLIAQAETVLTTHPEDIPAWGYGGLAYLLQGDTEAAQGWWFQALTVLDADQIQALGEWLGAQAEGYRDTQPQVGLELYRAAQELAPSPERLLSLIQLAATSGNLAPDELETAIQTLNAQPQLPWEMVYATLLAVVGEVEFSPEVEALIMACRPHLSPVVFARALAVASGKIQWKYQAPAVSERILKIAWDFAPNNTEILGRLANLYEDMGDLNRALELAQRYVELEPECCLADRVRARAILMKILMKMGGSRWQEAVQLIPLYHQALAEFAYGADDQLFHAQSVSEPPLTAGFFTAYLRDHPQQDRPVLSRVVSRSGAKIRNGIPYLYQTQTLGNSERLRVGFLSRSLTRHSVGWLARTFFNHYDQKQLELFLYYITSPPDNLGRSWFVDKCEHYYYHDYSQPLAKKIAADGIHILIDVDSLTLNTTCAVLAFKPAPIQVTWLGWDATGMDTIDYFIADPWVLPENAQDYYQETIWRLPETYIAVDGFEIGVPDVRREDLGIEPTDVIFFTAQSNYKRHPDVVHWQLQILQKVPNSYLCIKSLHMNAGLQEQFRTQAQALGIDPQRLRFLPPVDSEYVHRANVQCLADVILDTYPYNGATTTLEALWLGIPLVTRVGQQFAARNSYAFLTQCGISEGIAHSAEEYVDWGVRLGTDSVLRQDIRQRLLESRRTSPLWNGKRFAQQFGSALQEMWRLYQASGLP